MIAPSGEQFEIAAGDQQAVVVEVGGGLRSYSAGGRKLVDGYGADEMSSSGRGQVLIPWPNRLQDGSYEFDGRRHQLPLNEPQHHNASHGLVRRQPLKELRQLSDLANQGQDQRLRIVELGPVPLLGESSHAVSQLDQIRHAASMTRFPPGLRSG